MEILNNSFDLIKEYGYYAVFLGLAVDHSGIPVPLLIAVYFVLMGYLNIHYVVFLSIIAAVLSDIILYLIGYYGGRQVCLKWGKYIGLSSEKLYKSEQFFAKHGKSVVVFGRFYPIVGRFMPLVYGLNSINFYILILYTLLGGTLMALLFGYGGYLVGSEVLMSILEEPRAAMLVGIAVIMIQFIIIKIVARIKKFK